MSQTNENGSSAKTNIIDVFGNDTSRFMLPAFVIGTAAPYLFCSGMFARTVDQLAESRVADLLVSRLDVFASAMTRLAAAGDTHSARALSAALPFISIPPIRGSAQIVRRS